MAQSRKAKIVCKKRTRKHVRNLTKDTRVLMMYIAYRRYRSELTPEEILRDATGYLGEEHNMFGLELKTVADREGLRHLTMTELMNILRKSGTKKYKARSSPSYPAGPLCGYMLEGNDRRIYKSIRAGNSCVWKHVDLPLPYK
jgi:hypothetical protein